jgi:APA family basic amino acid/polyamine antiporter
VNTLARQLRATDYFTLGWGTMVGVGWLVIMDDWLLRGGALGALLGFVIGGALLLPIGWVYGKLVVAMPDAAGEIAYTSAVFSRPISFATGWMMTLAYFIVCPWEAVAVGRIAGYIVPGLDSVELYRIAGRPVYLPHLVIGLALTALLTLLNYRGIRLSATFQNWTSFGTLTLFLVFVALGVTRGSPANIQPLFTHTPLVSILLVIQVVPYFMTGFESVGKAAEEASPDFRTQGFFRAIWMAIVIGILFYASIVAAVAFVAPWRRLTGERFMTAVAFQQALGSRWIVNIILAAALPAVCCLLWDAVGWWTRAPERSTHVIRRRRPRCSALASPPPLVCCWGTRSWFRSPRSDPSRVPSDGRQRVRHAWPSRAPGLA